MRKFVWAGTVVVVLSAVAVYLAADYAAHHPDSWFGRCTAAAGYLGTTCNPFSGLGAATHGTCTEGTDVCEVIGVPRPEAGPDAFVGEGGEADEPIKVEPQPGFILPLDPADFPQAVPASEETPEPRFGPGEESEAPTDVTAPVHEEEEAMPPAMPYVEDDAPACKRCGSCPQTAEFGVEIGVQTAPACKTCGSCPQGCCDKGTCATDCAKGDCAKTSCTANCAKDGCSTTKCTSEAHTGTLIFGIGFNTETGLVGTIVCKPCSAGGCCMQGCCDWLMSLFGVGDCGKCCDSKAAATLPVATDSEAPNGDLPADSKSKNDSSNNDDVPNCQEDPSYSHQYPSCPYTGSPNQGCPYDPSYRHPAMTAPEGNPLDEVVPPKAKAQKKPSSNSLLHLMPSSYGSSLDPLSWSARGNGVASALRAVKKADAEDSDVHPEVDTMEARPTDVENMPSPNEPF